MWFHTKTLQSTTIMPRLVEVLVVCLFKKKITASKKLHCALPILSLHLFIWDFCRSLEPNGDR
jgi:hypothetical protein